MVDHLKPLPKKLKSTLAEAVYETLLEAIVVGKIDGGEVLSEVAVADALQVSRTPVNIAFKQLAKDGLVDRPANRRATVKGFTPDDIFEIFELRKYLEGPAAELAATRIDERTLAPLRDTLANLEETFGEEGWADRWAEHDEAFHRDIASASGNRRLVEAVTRYRLLHRMINKFAVDDNSLKKALQQHQRVFAALEAHDGAKAKKEMVAHIGEFQKYFIRALQRTPNMIVNRSK